MTIVPRTGPFSASSALATTSWYQRGKSSARGVTTGGLAMPRHRTSTPCTVRARFGPMKAAVLNSCPGDLEIEDVAIDKPGPREVLINTAAAGLCHSDL